jgi:hypothetical protein
MIRDKITTADARPGTPEREAVVSKINALANDPDWIKASKKTGTRNDWSQLVPFVQQMILDEQAKGTIDLTKKKSGVEEVDTEGNEMPLPDDATLERLIAAAVENSEEKAKGVPEGEELDAILQAALERARG